MPTTTATAPPKFIPDAALVGASAGTSAGAAPPPKFIPDEAVAAQVRPHQAARARRTVADRARETLARQGTSAALVKEAAAAGQPVPHREGGLHEPSFVEALQSGTASAVGGLAKGAAGLMTIPADVLAAAVNSPAQALGAVLGGGGLDDAVRESRNVGLDTTATAFAEINRASDRLKPAGAINEAGDYLNDLAGQLAVPIPGVAALKGARALPQLETMGTRLATIESELGRTAGKTLSRKGTRRVAQLEEEAAAIRAQQAALSTARAAEEQSQHEIGALVDQAGEAQAAARNIGPAGVRAAETTGTDFVADELARKQTGVPPPAELSGSGAQGIDTARSQAVAAQVRGEVPQRNIGPHPTAAATATDVATTIADAGAAASHGHAFPPAPLDATLHTDNAGLPLQIQWADRADSLTKLREFVEDDWIRVKNLMREPGVNVSEAADPYTREILSHGRIAARVEEAKALVTDIDNDIIHSASRAGVPDAEFARDVDEYLYARHAPERNAHLGDRAAGVSDAEAEVTMQSINALPHSPEIRRVADRLQALNNQTIDVLLEGEVIDQDLHDLLRNRYQNHIPLNRVMDSTEDMGALIGARPLDVRSSGLRRARGSERAVSDITSNIATNYQQAVVRAEKNRVDLATLQFARDNPQLDLFEEIRPRAIGERFAREGEPRQVIMQPVDDPQVLALREKGKPVYLRIKDPKLAVVLRGMNRKKVEGVLRIIGGYTRWMASLATRFNLDFPLPNKFRDLQEAMIYAYSKRELGASGALQIVKREADLSSIRAVMDGLAGKDTEGARMYRRMKRAGATTGGMGLSTRKTVGLDIDKIRQINRSSSRRAARALIEGIENINTVFEDSTRLSAFKTGLEKNMSDDAAGRVGKESTINFNKMGTGGPQINAMYMFANASIRGSMKMAQAMRNPKVATAVATTVGLAVASTAEWNDRMDPEWRTKVSKYDRLNGLPVVLPRSKDGSFNYMVIPVSWGIKPIKVAMDYASDAMSEKAKATPGEAVAGTAAAAFDAYNPLGGTDAWSTLSPTFFDLPLDLARNQSWSGGMIRPEWDKDALRSEKYFDDLGDSAQGRFFIDRSEGLSARGIEVSPADMKYAYESLIGGAGRFGSKVVSTTDAIGHGQAPKVEDVPVVSRFVRQVSADRVAARQDAAVDAEAAKAEKVVRAKMLREERAVKRREAPPVAAQDNSNQDENYSLVLNSDPRSLLPASWKTARKATVGVEVKHGAVVPEGGGAVYGMPVEDTPDARALRAKLKTTGSDADWQQASHNAVVTGQRVTSAPGDSSSTVPDAQRSIEQYVYSVMHELAHSAWFGGDVTAAQKAMWIRYHNSITKLEPERQTLSVMNYPNDPAHSFVASYQEYVLSPTAMKRDYPQEYLLMRRIVHKEYIRRQ